MTSSTSTPARDASVLPDGNAESTCPRCSGAFHCGVADDVPCHCMQARLTDAHRAALAARYDRCLCAACLASVAAGGAP